MCGDFEPGFHGYGYCKIRRLRANFFRSHQKVTTKQGRLLLKQIIAITGRVGMAQIEPEAGSMLLTFFKGNDLIPHAIHFFR